MQFTSLLTLLAATSASAHFVLNYPPSLGFNDDSEGQSPCGGETVTFANATNITAGQFALALTSTHPQAQYLFRATLNESAPYTWTNILPVVNEQGLGNMCLNSLRAPAGFEGRTALIQVIQAAADGELYQCAVVNFIAGSNTTVGPACTNATGLTATITNQQTLANSSSTNGTATTSASGSASASATHSSAAIAAKIGNVGFIGSLFAVIALL